MYVSRVSLVNFRNYASLDLALPPGLILLQGDNAQGKSNFLEAVFYLATSRSPRTNTDADLIGPHAADYAPGVARLSAQVCRTGGETNLEIALSGPRKQIKVNGVPRRAIDLLGALRVVLFRPEDLDLVNGPPAGRRRALDILLSQLDPAYPRALQRYNRVLLQRNHLLRRIAEGDAKQDELTVWDEPLIEHASLLMNRRGDAVERLSLVVAGAYREISDEQEELACSYTDSARGDLRTRLAEALRKDIALGQTTAGPHRDDLDFQIAGRPAASFASRGQQRSAVLAWKQAEGQYLREQTGEDPVLLLDDVLSELDHRRRRAVMGTAGSYQQVILTMTGAELGEMPLRPAAWFRAEAGTLTAL